MEPVPVLAGLLGTSVALIVGLLGFVGLSIRRNGRNGGNPNFSTIEVQIQQMIDLQRDANKQLGDMAVTLGKLDTKIGLCPTVQQGRGG